MEEVFFGLAESFFGDLSLDDLSLEDESTLLLLSLFLSEDFFRPGDAERDRE